MKNLLAVLALVFSSVAVAGPLDKYVPNSNSGGNVVMRVNNAGTPIDAMTIYGTGPRFSLFSADNSNCALEVEKFSGGPAVTGIGGNCVGLFRRNNSSANSADLFVAGGATGVASLRLGDSTAYTGGSLSYNNSTDVLSIGAAGVTVANSTASGAWTLGADGGTQTHTVNGSLNTTQTMRAVALQRSGAYGVTFNEGATVSLFATSTNASYIVHAMQEGGTTPNGVTCFIYIGNNTSVGLVNMLGATGEITCTVAGGNVNVTNVAGGSGNTTMRWGYNAIF